MTELYIPTRLSLTVVLGVSALLCPGVRAQAPLTTLYTFNDNPDGYAPNGSLISDGNGALYGVTAGGGQSRWGTVFQLVPPSAAGGAWTENVLYSFQGLADNPGPDGSDPSGSLIFDGQGNLYGTAVFGGAGNPGCGVVFELSPPGAASSTWTQTVLYKFGGPPADGCNPNGSLAMDANGALYGTTWSGGPSLSPTCPTGCGTTFQLVPPAAPGGAWTEKMLYSFQGGNDGGIPTGNVVLGKRGVVYGTTSVGGASGYGVVFALRSSSASPPDWDEHVLYSFTNGADGGKPTGALVFDNAGNLYGTTAYSGSGGGGTVFQLTRPTSKGTSWGLNIILSPNGADGAEPVSLTMGLATIYGTTAGGGINNKGVIFQLAPPTMAGSTWTETVIYRFNDMTLGEYPPINGGMLLSGGKLFGVTRYGGTVVRGCSQGCGTVFQVGQ
jgi:hypothetical protein